MLTEIPADALRTVLQNLEPRDLCRCQAACKKLRQFACEDSVWEAQCRRWFKRHGQHTSLSEASPENLRAQLACPSFTTLFRVLSSLGGWPEGLWYRVDYRGQPHGSLVQIKSVGSLLHVCKLDAAAMQLGSFFQILLDRLPVQIIIGAADGDHLILPRSFMHVNSRAGTLKLQLAHQQNSAEKAPVIMRNGQGSHEVTLLPLESNPSLQAIPSSPGRTVQLNWLPLFETWLNGDDPSDQSLCPLMLRRVIPLPNPLPHPRRPLVPLTADFTAANALQRLAGLWTAWYGGHGPEILHIWFEDSLQSHQPSSPSNEPDYMPRPRLVACKVTGDPNVPANETSFRAQAAGMRLGRWNGIGTWHEAEEEEEEEEEEFRPILNFNGLPTLVDMRSRPVLARFRCQGRINHDPFNYRPLWVPAQLILYERPEPMFSVLFDDRGERIKHIMDFTPVPFPCDSA